MEQLRRGFRGFEAPTGQRSGQTTRPIHDIRRPATDTEDAETPLGMHFMDRYNYDTERIRRCVITYSTPDGFYPFCTINCGPSYRPYIEEMNARPLEPSAGERQP